MNKLFNTIFPLFDWLYILQTLEYDSTKFIKWILKNYFKRDLQQKKTLIWTPKIILLFIVSLGLLTFDIAFFYYFLSYSQNINYLTLAIQVFVLFQISFVLIWASNILLEPLDNIIKIYYVEQAKRILQKHDKLKVIGITGSYGKTSTKEVLAHLLETKYKVLKTPGSFNTTLGVAQIIKKELRDDHEIFIVEMGAYKQGEVKAICDLTKPKLGIITGINEQHLDRFKTLENTVKAKTELATALIPNGTLAINLDNEYLREYYNEHLKGKQLTTIPYTIETKSSWQAEKITLKNDDNTITTTFSFDIGRNKKLDLETKLLGKHNVLNIMGALAIAEKLNIHPSKYQEALRTLASIEHRLQHIPTNNGITVIDDAYSGNPSGFEAALEVLSQIKNKRKIIVTPGIVELGKEEFTIHEILGEKTGNVCDIIILIGSKTDKEKTRIDGLVKGIEKNEFPKENLHIVNSLSKAQEKIAELSRLGDVILFENDLPDNY